MQPGFKNFTKKSTQGVLTTSQGNLNIVLLLRQFDLNDFKLLNLFCYCSFRHKNISLITKFECLDLIDQTIMCQETLTNSGAKTC